MAEEKKGEKQVLMIHLPETLAKRLSLAATRANCSLADMALEILDRNLPRLTPPTKRAPYT